MPVVDRSEHRPPPPDPPPPPESGPAFPGLAEGELHELHADDEDWGAALAFALVTLRTGRSGPIVLVRGPGGLTRRLRPYGEGLRDLGIDPGRLLIVEAPDEKALLRAGLDAARSPALAAVVLETWGALRSYDLTASRRLVLAAERSQVGIVVLRGAAEPRHSAAHSRWRLRPAPTPPAERNEPVPWLARWPGPPAIEAELLRRRGAPGGVRWRLEWDGEHGRFRADRTMSDNLIGSDPSTAGAAAAPLSGAVVALAAQRTDPPARHVA